MQNIPTESVNDITELTQLIIDQPGKVEVKLANGGRCYPCFIPGASNGTVIDTFAVFDFNGHGDDLQWFMNGKSIQSSEFNIVETV